MEFAWTWWALGPLIIWVVAWVVAWLVYSTAPRRTVNRLLAIVLFLEGAFFGAQQALYSLATDPGDALALYITGDAALPILGTLYLVFVARAVDTRATRAMRRPAVVAILAACALVASAIVVFRPDVLELTVEPDDSSVGHWVVSSGNLIDLGVSMFWIGAIAVALVVSIVALRAAPPGSLTRRRMRTFVAAFGLRDAYYLLLILTVIAMFGTTPPSRLGLEGPARIFLLVTFAGTFVVIPTYMILLAYGILRGQLLDIDVKLRWTVRQSTVAAVFVAVFVLVAALVERWADSMGVLWGGVAAAALVFALHPIQRFAGRVAEATVPRAPAAADLPAADRTEIYAEQLRFAWADGAVDRSERLLLENLRQRLAISAEEAARVEREFLERAATG